MENQGIKSVSLKSAFIAGVVRSISPVRENENGFLFVTVLNGAKSTNVYFGKKSAESFSEDDVLTKEQLLEMMFIVATNEDGEERIKIALNGSSDYTDLASMFDDVTPVNNAELEAEVLAILSADMTTREEDESEEEEEEEDDADAVAKAKAIRDAKKAKGATTVKKK
jgi:hypothetical protein